ncbi:hypothetical protein FACS189499_08580 [Clostridia bacterium]|nr:hypothetical protein FACS189499_08580 [Clostridia bacterium]
MYGTNGEYNLKFVSLDGKYEAVYNKNGVLLKAENDPINMGTYKYTPDIKLPYIFPLSQQTQEIAPVG